MEPGRALRDAQRTKERRYPELVEAQRCHLLVLVFEVGGRWCQGGVEFLHMMAQHKAQGVPRLLRKSAHLLFFQRWSGMLACAVQRAYAVSLLEKPLASAACVNGYELPISELSHL